MFLQGVIKRIGGVEQGKASPVVGKPLSGGEPTRIAGGGIVGGGIVDHLTPNLGRFAHLSQG